MTLSIGIRGAGAAGMCLAYSLVQKIPDCSIHLFDTRTSTPHPDRTFCFFDDGSIARFKLPVATQWNNVCFKGQNFSRTCSSSSAPYSLLHGETFFSNRLATLERSQTKFSWGQPVVQIAPTKISTIKATYNFDLTVDTAFNPHNVTPLLWQSFAGHWITTKTDQFDPDAATLMDLQESSEKAPISFLYVLPISSRAALIEHTCFSIEPLSHEWHLTQCEAWLKEKGIKDWEVERSEKGLIPMGFPAPKKTSGVITLGSNSGAIRASTGYAFLNILRQAEELAESFKKLVNSTSSPHHDVQALTIPSPAVPSWMEIADHMFLTALKRMPLSGGAIMSSLLSRAPEAPLLRFLQGQTTLFEALRVMSSVPKFSMLKALYC